MYAALWRVLPGPWWLRMIFVLILAAAVVYALFFWVFPAIAPFFAPGEESTVG